MTGSGGPAAGPSPIPLLFLVGDTGGGHRSAARAVAQALERAYPGKFAPVTADPLLGDGAPRAHRWVIGLYGPAIRLAPWLWGLLWRLTATRPGLAFWRQTLFRPAARLTAAAVKAHRPAVIVSFHPMTARPAARARALAAPGAPVVTVITDLVTTHPSWREPAADLIVTPSAAVTRDCRRDGIPARRCAELGLPVGAEFTQPPATPGQRRALRASLGLPADGFLAVLTGGAEGSGRMRRRAGALLRRHEGIHVAVICGRNRRLLRRLTALSRRSGGRLTAVGFVSDMADWLRCADVVVAKAGPQTIAEAACCGAPLLLASAVPGQEAGNAELVVAAGAGRRAPTVRALLREVGELRRNPAALAAMRAAASGLSRPGAAADVAELLAGLAAGGSAGGVQPADRGALRRAPERLQLLVPRLAEQQGELSFQRGRQIRAVARPGHVGPADNP